MNDDKNKPFPPPEKGEGDPREVDAMKGMFDSPAQKPDGKDIFEQDIFSAPPIPPMPPAKPSIPPRPVQPAPPAPKPPLPKPPVAQLKPVAPPQINAAQPPKPQAAALPKPPQTPPKPAQPPLPKQAAPPPPPAPPPPAPAPSPKAKADESDPDVKIVGLDDFEKLSAAPANSFSVFANTPPPGSRHVPAGEDEEDDMPEFVMITQPVQSPPNPPPAPVPEPLPVADKTEMEAEAEAEAEEDILIVSQSYISSSEENKEIASTEPALPVAPEEPPAEDAQSVVEDWAEDWEETVPQPDFLAAAPDIKIEESAPTEANRAVAETNLDGGVFSVDHTPPVADKKVEASAADVVFSEKVSIEPATDPLVFKAAKAKDGPEVIKQTEDLIDRLDGLDEGFLDAAEIERAVKSVQTLMEEIRELRARVEALEAKLK